MKEMSKAELQRAKQETEEQTEKDLEDLADVEDDASDAVGDFVPQPEAALTDTKEELDFIAEAMGRDMKEVHGAQAEVVGGAIEKEAEDISEPAREGAQVEGDAADDLRAASGKSERAFRRRLAEAAGARQDAGEYLAETAKESEIHQEATKEGVSDSEQSLNDSIRDLTSHD